MQRTVTLIAVSTDRLCSAGGLIKLQFQDAACAAPSAFGARDPGLRLILTWVSTDCF